MANDEMGLSKRDILMFVFKWKATIFGWALFMIAFVTFLSYAISPVYPVSSKVVVERNKEPTLRSSVVFDGLETLEAMNNKVAILKSRPVLEAVVSDLQPHLRPRSEGWARDLNNAISDWLANTGLLSKLSPTEKWIDRLSRGVDATPIPSSNILEITYADEDPEWSAKIVNSMTDEFIQKHLSVYSSASMTTFYKDRLVEAEGILKTLRDQAQAYRTEAEVSAVTDRRRQLVRELTDVRGDLAEVRVARAKLLQRFESDHPEVQVETNRIAALENAINSAQTKLATLEEQGAFVEALELRIGSAEDTTQDLQRRLEDAQLNAASTAETINVRVIQYAEVPAQPKYARLLLILISIPLGFLISIGVALLRQFLDHRVDDPDLAEEILGVTYLGSIPKIEKHAKSAS